VSDLAKEGVKAKRLQSDYENENYELHKRVDGLTKKLEGYQGGGMTDTIRYYQAKERAPRRLEEVVADIMRQPPENQHQRERNQQHRKTKGEERG
jgi:hypothetical protein